MTSSIIVMERLIAGKGVITPNDLIHAVAMYVNARRSPSVRSLLKKIPAVVVEVSRRVGVDIAAISNPALHTSPKRIVAKPGECSRWHVGTPDRDRLIQRVVARGHPSFRHR